MHIKNRLILITIILAMLTVFAAFEASIAADLYYPTEPNECAVVWKDGKKWFSVGLFYEDGAWPAITTCTTEEGDTVQAAKFEYHVTGGTGWQAGKWYQTIPGQRPGSEQYEVYEECSHSSIDYIPPGEGSNTSFIPCYAQFIGDVALLESTAAPTGNPPKFGHTSNQFGANGWSSLGFNIGNEITYCKQYDAAGNVIGYGLPGPSLGDKPRLIRNVEKVLKFQAPDGTFIEVVLLINETDCTFTATIDGNPLDQFPLTDLKITGPDGSPMQVLEGWGSGKCDEATYEGTGSTCVFYTLGGRACKYCF